MAEGREAIFDAEHFFDGHARDPDHALEYMHVAMAGEIVSEVIAAGIPGARLGIHAHDDTGITVACSLAAVDVGARQVQGTLNGMSNAAATRTS